MSEEIEMCECYFCEKQMDLNNDAINLNHHWVCEDCFIKYEEIKAGF